MDNKVEDNSLLKYIFLFLAIGTIMIYCISNIFHYKTMLDADMASEAVLTKVIADNGFVQPDTWIASTETRIISAPNIAAVLYRLTGDLSVSMGMACSIMLIILVVLMAIYYGRIGFSSVAGTIAVLVPLVVASNIRQSLSMFALLACYYSPHLIVFFYMLILWETEVDTKTKHYVMEVIGVILAVLMGLQGMRGLLMVYIPLTGTHLVLSLYDTVRNKKICVSYQALYTVLVSIISFICMKMNSIFGESTSRNLRHGTEKLINEVLPDVVSLYTEDKYSSYCILVLAVLSAAGFILLLLKKVFKEDKNKSVVDTSDDNKNADNVTDNNRKTINSNIPEMNIRHRSLLAIPAAFIFIVLAFAYTTIESASRYYIVSIFVIGVGVALIWDNYYLPRRLMHIIRAVIVVAALIVTFTTDINVYTLMIKADNTAESSEQKVIDYVLQNGCEAGYSTFDYSNILSVYGNGDIIIASINSFGDMDGTKWLSDESFYGDYVGTDMTTAYIATKEHIEEMENFIENNNLTEDDYLYKKIGYYYVYILNRNYTSMSE